MVITTCATLLCFLLNFKTLPIQAINEHQWAVNNFFNGEVSKSITDKDFKTQALANEITCYFPEQAGKYPLVVFVHGWGCDKRAIISMARFIAQYGYVTAAISVKQRRYPEDWPPALESAFECIYTAIADKASPLYNKVDLTKQAVVGHSMGGAGVLHYANKHPEINSVVALHPYNGGKGIVSWVGGENKVLTDVLPNHRAKTLILSGSKDTIALPEKTYKFFKNLEVSRLGEENSQSGKGQQWFSHLTLSNEAKNMLFGAIPLLNTLNHSSFLPKILLNTDLRDLELPNAIWLLIDEATHTYTVEVAMLNNFHKLYKSAYLSYNLLVYLFLQASFEKEIECKNFFIPGTEEFKCLEPILAVKNKKNIPAFGAK